MLGLLPRPQDIDASPGLRMLGLELLFWALVILFTIALVRYRPPLLERAETWLREVSRHKGFWLVTFVLGVIVIRLALLLWIPVPVPSMHDEFSYLLASDTFAHGRLTNPPSPMWVHFESFHINVQPTYESMYPPAQGLALAVGQVLTGVPWVGVLASTALMCGAIYWMLLGWLPAPWAWLGGAFACLRFGIFSYWMNSYWGGAVAALGGALVLGAFPRFRNRPTIQTGIILAAGLLILANSRPLEGFLFSIPFVLAAVVILINRIRGGKDSRKAALKIVFPAVALLAVGAAWMLFYNWRGTGNPMVMPYQVNFQTYHISKPFVFQKSNPVPEYRHRSMRALYLFLELPLLMKSKYDMQSIIQGGGRVYYGFYVWPFLFLIVPCLYAMGRSEMRLVLVSMALLISNMIAQIWFPQPHYASPAAGALILAVLYSVHHFRKSQSQHVIWGSRALAIMIAVWMISPIAEAVRDPFAIFPNVYGPDAARFSAPPFPFQLQRRAIQSELESRAGKQLVIVHYPYRYVPWMEWVYNDADIDGAHVVWARDMGYLKNKELLNYYSDRQTWYIDRDDTSPLLLPYDQVMAPLKLAFDGAPAEKESPQTAGVGQLLPSTIDTPVPVSFAEIGAPRAK